MKLLFPLVLLVAAPLYSQAPGIWAFKGGTVHTVSGPTIEGGTVVVRRGLIESVGANVSIPAEATVIDVSGMHVYPGLIDAHSTLLINEPKSEGPPRDGSGEAPPLTSAATRVATLIDWTRAADIEKARRAGITTLRVSPRSRVFDGLTPLVNLGEGPLEQNIVDGDVAQQVSFVPRTDSAWPVSLMGVVAHIRQTFLDARHQRDAVRIYESDPSGRLRPTRREELSSLAPVIAGEMPLIMTADTSAMIDRALTLARELEVRPIISGAVDAWDMADELRTARVPVILTADTPAAVKDAKEDEPLRLLRRRVHAPEGAAALQRRDVAFAWGTHGAAPDRFLPAVRAAVKAGLAESEAVEALTLSAARILGVERQLGSIERGKVANLIVTDLPLLNDEMQIEHMLVDGRPINLPEAEKDESEEDDQSPYAGSWAIRVDVEAEELEFQVTLRGDADSLEGSWSGREESGELAGVGVTEEGLEFVLSTSDRVTGDTTDWRFEAVVDGDTMTGTATTATGTYQIRGTRNP